MKASFEINLPSIPGKNIKFKIQDIKSSAFGTQKARFPDNKTILTKKFVQSFHNFHQTKRDDELETQPESQMGKSYVSAKREVQFRPFVSDNKKFLLPVYSQVKQQQKQKIQNSLQPNLNKSGGYSFAKAGILSQNAEQLELYKNYRTEKNTPSGLTDNYYFTNQVRKNQQNQKVKRQKPSAVFKNQTRKRVQDRIYASDVPGPGTYLKDKPNSKKKSKRDQIKQQNNLTDYKHLKNVITKVLAQQEQIQEQQIIKKPQIRPNHMFVLDDRDRFGQQIFPIAPKLKVPGPGSYQTNDNLEQKAKKIVLVEEQRKLLKQWFNN